MVGCLLGLQLIHGVGDTAHERREGEEREKDNNTCKYALLVGSAANGAITDPSNFLK